MTRDEALSEAEAVAQNEVDLTPDGPWKSAAIEIRNAIRALKSKPPEKSPEVEDVHLLRQRAFAAEAEAAGFLAGCERLQADLDALRQRYAEAQRERAETDALLIAANKRAHDAEAEIARLEWEAKGARMKGETP